MERLSLALWLAWCLARPAQADSPSERRFPDDEVLASQRYFSKSWHEHYGKGDAEYCGTAYLDDASVLMRLGPAAADIEKLAGWQDPHLVRGAAAIKSFWNETIAVLGLKNLRDEEGATTELVLDDNTVVLERGFAFDQVRGHVFSEIWVRSAEEWKLRSSVMAIESQVAPLGAHAASEAAAPSPAPAAALAEAKGGSTSASDAGSSEAKGGHTLLVLLLLTISGLGAALLMHRSRRRKQAIIAGFEEMLG